MLKEHRNEEQADITCTAGNEDFHDVNVRAVLGECQLSSDWLFHRRMDWLWWPFD
jgi:hypothetical protein